MLGRSAAAAHVARRSGCGARPSRPATCSTRSPAISAPSGPSGRSPSMPKAATHRIAPEAEADIHLLRFTEHLLASAIGAASSRLVLSLLLRRARCRQPVRLAPARRCLRGAAVQPRPPAVGARSGAARAERVRQGHAADLLEPAVPRAAQPAARARAASALRSTGSCAPAPSAATSAPATSTSSSPTGLMKLAAGARDVPGAVRRRPAHPRDPHQPACPRAASSPPIPTSPSASRPPRRWRAPTRRWSGACGSARPS